MKTNSTGVLEKVGSVITAAKAAPKDRSEHCTEFRSEMVRGTLLSAAAATLGVLAFMVLSRAIRAARSHSEWKHVDESLDSALEDSLDASDAVARY